MSIAVKVVSLCLLFVMVVAPSFSIDMKADVDATDISRGLIKSTMRFNVDSRPFVLFYPEWIPGIHAPRGPVENLAEIIVSEENGNRLHWSRTSGDVFRIEVSVPNAVKQIEVKTTYICNQPSVNSRGIDSYGNPFLGVINWNTCLLYPANHPANQVNVNIDLRLPSGWKWASSLKSSNKEKDSEKEIVVFQSVSFEELVDSPLICGIHLKTFDLTSGNMPPHFLHLVSESETAIKPEEKTIAGLKRIVQEGMMLFQNPHFDEYHFLLVLSDSVPGIGLEHLKSSLNAVRERGLLDENSIPNTANLLSHEYSHSWCGKYHRPQGMITPNFNTAKDTRLLWVYEGLDQYLGNVLAARAEMNAIKDKSSFDESLKRLGRSIQRHFTQTGRKTINLEDTAASSFIRRGGSQNWEHLHRGQDYYNEGAMLWMEIDAIIREKSEGKQSLDNFVRAFLGPHDPAQSVIGFTEETILAKLNDVLPYDWQSLIDNRVRGYHEQLPLEFLHRVGYRLQFSNKPTDMDDNMIFTSLGMFIRDDGTIERVVPGSPADQSGLYDNAKLIGVGDRKFSLKRLEDAIAESVANRKIELLVLEGDLFRHAAIHYADGPRFMELIRSEDPDLLKEIWKPLVKNSSDSR